MVPTALSRLIVVNTEYRVLVYLKSQCCKAVNPASLVEHLYKIYYKEPWVRKQVQEFAARVLWRYNYATVLLLADGLAPQPNIPTLDGLQYWDCLFKLTN